MVVCCQGATDRVVAVAAVEEVEELLGGAVDPPVVPVLAVVPPSPVVPAVVAGLRVVEVPADAAGSPVATTDVRGRSVTSAPAALTATYATAVVASVATIQRATATVLFIGSILAGAGI
jgi:hypothetical protein